MSNVTELKEVKEEIATKGATPGKNNGARWLFAGLVILTFTGGYLANQGVTYYPMWASHPVQGKTVAGVESDPSLTDGLVFTNKSYQGKRKGVITITVASDNQSVDVIRFNSARWRKLIENGWTLIVKPVASTSSGMARSLWLTYGKPTWSEFTQRLTVTQPDLKQVQQEIEKFGTKFQKLMESWTGSLPASTKLPIVTVNGEKITIDNPLEVNWKEIERLAQ